MALLLEKGYSVTGQDYSASGGREDLSDLISNVDAKSTVFTSLAKKGKKPGNVVMGWQMDKYDSPSGAGVFEGVDVVTGDYVNPAKDRALMQNYVQIFRRSFRISNLANEIQIVAGIKSELANGIAKKLVEIKRDMEYCFLGNADADVESGAQNPYMTKGLGSYITAAGTAHGTTDDVVVPDGYRTPAASIETTVTGSLTEAKVQDLLKSIYNTTGSIRDYDLVCGPTLKRVFTNFTQSITNVARGASGNSENVGSSATAIKTFSQDAASRRYINAIDVFEGDFGRLRLHPSVHINTTTTAGTDGNANETAHGGTVTARPTRGFVIPFDLAEIRYGKLPQIKELTDNGGGPARLVEAMAALVIYNPSAFGAFSADS